jgi:hypothetical protein
MLFIHIIIKICQENCNSFKYESRMHNHNYVAYQNVRVVTDEKNSLCNLLSYYTALLVFRFIQQPTNK